MTLTADFDDLDASFQSPPALPFTLMPHQQQAVDFMVSRPSAGIFVNIGAGKTLATLAALHQLRPLGYILVIAPVAIARSTWLDEIDHWQLPIRTRSLIVNERDKKLTRAQRLQRYEAVFTDPPTMYFINQELIPDLVAQMPRQQVAGAQSPSQQGAGSNSKTHTAIVWPFGTVIIDESQEFKSHASQRFKALASVRPAISRLIALTGTPAPNGLHDLWAQVFLLDQGEALGHNITAFRNRWFAPRMVYGTNTPATWIPNPGAEHEIYAAIRHLVMSAVNDSLTLPDPVIDDVALTLPEDLSEAYRDFKRELVLDVAEEASHRLAEQAFDQWWRTAAEPDAQALRDRLGALEPDSDDYALVYAEAMESHLPEFTPDPTQGLVRTVVAENRAVLVSKLMQFASGTLYTADPDDPATRGRYEVLHDLKVRATLELVGRAQAQDPPEPVLLSYHFRSDREQLLSALQATGIAAEAFDGSRDTVRRWNARQIPVLLLHPASAGPGLNLQRGSRTLIWFTLPFSLKHYQQLNGRLHRTGQTQQVTIHRLLTTGTQDQRMPGVLDAKKHVQDNLLTAVSLTMTSDFEAALAASVEAEILDDLGDPWVVDRT